MSVEYLYVLPILVLFVFYFVRAIVLQRGRQKAIQKLGCKPPPGLPQLDPVFEVLSSFRERRRNASFKEQFDRFWAHISIPSVWHK